MTSVKYETIFKLFLGSITDYDFTVMSDEDANELMTEYLHKSLSASYLSRIFDEYELNDETSTLSFEMAYDTGKDESDFVASAVSKWMVYEWFQNQVNSVLNSAQFFGGSEQKFYSQQAHSSEIRQLVDNAYKEARSFVMDRGWIKNSYLGGK